MTKLTRSSDNKFNTGASGSRQAPSSGAEAASTFSPTMSAEQVMQLQSVIGNSAVARMIPPTPSGNRTGLPDSMKTSIESLSGFAMDDVKVHYNSPKPAEIEAHAYAKGNNIHLGAGQEKHLPHEAWHVVQQKQGRVQPTVQAKGKIINDNSELEREADRMGEKLTQSAPAPIEAHAYTEGNDIPELGVIQGKWIKDASGKVSEVKDSYKLKKGEKEVEDPDLSDDEADDEYDEEDSESDSGADSESESSESSSESDDDGSVEQMDLGEEYTRYQKMKDKGKQRKFVEEALDYSSSEADLSADSEGVADDIRQIFSVKKSIDPEVTNHLTALSDQVGKERNKGGSLTEETFNKVGNMHNDREGVVSVRDNRVLHAAHREIIPVEQTKDNPVPIKYPDYRKKMNKAIPQAIEKILDHNEMDLERVQAHLGEESGEELESWIDNGAVDLKNKDSKSAALEHKINKGGKFGYPKGQVRSRNLVLVNDDRKNNNGPHALMHSVKGAEGSGKTNYSALDEDGAAAIAAGINKRKRTDSSSDESSSSESD